MNLCYVIVRLLKKLKPNAIYDCDIDPKAYAGHGNQLVKTRLGRYTYLGDNCTIIRTEIGAFCSISGGANIGGGGHAMHFASTSPVFNKGRNILNTNFSDSTFEPFKDTFIGNDVWIGARCMIKSGIRIGTGAVIGMGSVVTKDVPPYAVVAGNPAQVIRFRFDEKTIETLLQSHWWEWSEEKLRLYGPLFANLPALMDIIRNNKEMSYENSTY